MTAGQDPVSAPRDQLRVLGVSVAAWEDRVCVRGTAAERKAASAIDAMLRDLYLLRGRLTREIRTADEAGAR